MILPEFKATSSELHRLDPRRWIPRPRVHIEGIDDEKIPRPDRLLLIFINGRSSSGKDTQADLLAERIYPGAIRLSTGDIVRGAQDETNEYYRYNERLRTYFEDSNNGGFIPDQEMLEVVQAEIEYIIENKLQQDNIVNGTTTFIFTGFPRTIGQDQAIDSVLSEGLREHYPIDHLHILYDVEPEISRERAASRRADISRTPRKDDQEEVVERRLNEFTASKQTRDTLFNRIYSGKQLIIVPGNGSIEEVHQRTVLKVHEQSKPLYKLATFLDKITTSRRLRDISLRRNRS